MLGRNDPTIVFVAPPRDWMPPEESDLAGFEQSIERFKQTTSNLADTLSVAAFVPFDICGQVQSFALDLRSLVALLREIHQRAVEDGRVAARVYSERLGDAGAMSLEERRAALTKSADSDGYLYVLFKSVFFFIRAHQDAVYKVILASLGDNVGTYSSMQDAAKANNPVRRLLDRRLPEYGPWFSLWRSRRNTVKLGAGSAGTPPGQAPGILLPQVDGQSGGIRFNVQNAVRLGDVAEAIDMTARLIEVAVDVVNKRVQDMHGRGRDVGAVSLTSQG